MEPIAWYQGKRVFVTGGSSGIGKAVALILARSGAHVAIAARGQARLEETEAELRQVARSASQRFAHFAGDVADREAMRATAAKAVEALGGIDVLINNAGVAHPATLLDTSDDVFETMMRINYFGAVYTTRAFWPTFAAQRHGHIAFVSSVLGFMGIYGYTAYAASKFAMVGFAECLRQEALDVGVKVHVLYPPDTDTPQLLQENATKPPETKAIAGKIKIMSAEVVATALLRGIAAGRYAILPGANTKFTHFMQTRYPWVVRMAIDRTLKKYRRQHPPSG